MQRLIKNDTVTVSYKQLSGLIHERNELFKALEFLLTVIKMEHHELEQWQWTKINTIKELLGEIKSNSPRKMLYKENEPVV